MERTFVMVKPDGVQRGIVGEVISRLERKGFKMAALKMIRVDEPLARQHYMQHRDKPFFEPLIRYITSAPVVCMVWEGPNSIASVRMLAGVTDPAKAAPGTIRGDYAADMSFNIVHASDSQEAAAREIDLFFRRDELVQWQRSIDQWLWI